MRRFSFEVRSDIGDTVWRIETSSKDDFLKFFSFIDSLFVDEDDSWYDVFSSSVEDDIDFVCKLEKGRVGV